jgi:hypothetical protein
VSRRCVGQVSVTGRTHARLVAEAERRGNGTRSMGAIVEIVEQALAGDDWAASLEKARANRIAAVSHSRGKRVASPKRLTLTLSDDSQIFERLRAYGTTGRKRAVDRAVNLALDAVGAP